MSATKSNAPWSVKGIERDARETAKEAAKREGKTVGEWLNQIIYSAGDEGETSGDIQGLKARDLVTAIEHLNRRLVEADRSTEQSVSDLSRNVGAILERVQRLERVKPESGANEDLVSRVARLEEASSSSGAGKSRVDALKALEKAVGQVAIQFNTHHQSSLKRIEENEKQLQQLAQRLDTAPVNDEGGSDPTTVNYLKGAIEGLSTRLEQAELIASQAKNLSGDAAGSSDPEFIEQTGARLRILGDEIKRGGDQISALESTIDKLSAQIEAAERRSAEGVQKVSETITAVREQFTGDDPTPAQLPREEIAEAVADAGREQAAKIEALQSSLDKVLSRLDEASAVSPSIDETGETTPFTELVAEEASDPSSFVETDDETANTGETPDTTSPDRDPLDELSSSFDADPVVESGTDAEDDFGFDLDDDDGITPPSAEPQPQDASSIDDVLALVDPEDETAGAETTDTPSASSEFLSDLEEIEDPEEETSSDTGTSIERAGMQTSLADAVSTSAETTSRAPAADESDEDKQSIEKSEGAAKQRVTRRQLTPKQKALLAARARRKKLAELQGQSDAGETSEKNTNSATQDDELTNLAAEDGGQPSRISAMTAAFRNRFGGGAKETQTSQSIETENDQKNPAKAGSPLEAIKSNATTRPVTMALGIAILLAVAALFFLVKDLVFKSPEQIGQPPIVSAPPASTGAAPTPTTEVALEVPSAPTINPRDLYTEAMALLNAAETEAESTAAIAKLNESAALGHPPAQLQLGELFKLGQGVEQDLGQARTWFRRAANGGNVLAMHRIGVMTARGDGGLADTNEAISWFELAANRGLVDSQYNLGAIFHPSNDGSATRIQDAGKAYYWYSLAAKNGDAQSAPLAAGVGASLSAGERQNIDARLDAWKAEAADPISNEMAPAAG